MEKEQIPGLTSAHQIVMQDGQYQIKTLKPLKIEDSIYYVETTKDVTDIFKFREGQFRLFRQILTGLVLLIAVVVMMRWESLRRTSIIWRTSWRHRSIS